jgi:hypothetical protein
MLAALDYQNPSLALDYFPDDVLFAWLDRLQGHVVLFSDDKAFQAEARKRLKHPVSCKFETTAQPPENLAFLEFLTLSRCSAVCGTLKSSFSKQAAIYGNIPYTPITEELVKKHPSVEWISLGNACNVKYQIDRHLASKGQSRETLFFDWLLSDMNSVCELLSGETDPIRADALAINEKPRRFEHSCVTFKALTYCESLHDLPAEYTASDVEEFIRKYKRRLERIKEIVRSENPIVFIRYGAVTTEERERFKTVICALNGRCNYQLVSLVNGIAMTQDADFLRSLGSGGVEESGPPFHSIDLRPYRRNYSTSWETSCYDWRAIFSTMEILSGAAPSSVDSMVLGLVIPNKCKTVDEAFARIVAQTIDVSRIHLMVPLDASIPSSSSFASIQRYEGESPMEQFLETARLLGAHFCTMQANYMLEPHVLQTLLDSKDKGVIAPMLVSATRYSNYHAKVDANGYCVDDPLYDDLLYKRVKGQITVPVVNGIYFVNNALLPKIKYSDGTHRDSYVIMSDGLRKQGIPQYLDNRQFHGTIC